MSLGLVVFSNINYLFIYDVILTAFRIILSTWLYNYQFTTDREGQTRPICGVLSVATNKVVRSFMLVAGRGNLVI